MCRVALGRAPRVARAFRALVSARHLDWIGIEGHRLHRVHRGRLVFLVRGGRRIRGERLRGRARGLRGGLPGEPRCRSRVGNEPKMLGSVSARGSGRGGVVFQPSKCGIRRARGRSSGWAKFSIAGESRDAPLGPDTMARSGLRSQTLSSARPDPRRRGCGGRSASCALCGRGSGRDRPGNGQRLTAGELDRVHRGDDRKSRA
jgi:hypothetical protein